MQLVPKVLKGFISGVLNSRQGDVFWICTVYVNWGRKWGLGLNFDVLSNFKPFVVDCFQSIRNCRPDDCDKRICWGGDTLEYVEDTYRSKEHSFSHLLHILGTNERKMINRNKSGTFFVCPQRLASSFCMPRAPHFI